MKTIAVPLSSEATARLDMDLNEPGDLVEMYLDDEAFQRLWSTGVLLRLNTATGSMIDDFEDESILGESQLEKAIEVLERSSSLNSCVEEEELLRLFRKAKYFRTGVYFFF